MFKDTNIGFIGGGNMGSALIKGIIDASLVMPRNINLFDIDSDKVRELEQKHQIRPSSSIGELARDSNIIVLAVKPQVLSEVLEELKAHLDHNPLVISIAAGIPLKAIASLLPAGIPLIRVMPNTPALVQEGASALVRGDHVTEKQMEQALALFSSVGLAVEVKEDLMDAVTGLSGSGPAYVLLFLEGLIDAGVLMGLSRPLARKLAVQTIIGTARMVEKMDAHPAVLKDMITSPGGTTIWGLRALENAAIRGAVLDAVRAATERSKELGRIYSC